MKNFEKYDELTFVRELSQKIKNQYPNCILKQEHKVGRLRPDLYIDNGFENFVIEVKMHRNYSSMPFSTLIQLEDYKNSFLNAQIILISFSHINTMMLKKMKEMNILNINNPTSFEEIISKIFNKNVT